VEIKRADAEIWSLDISSSTSSPILVGDRVYIVLEKGDLCSVDVNTGKILWKLKLGIEQRNACPLYADGKLFVPMLDDPNAKSEGSSEAGTTGAFYVIQPGDTEGKILQHLSVEGRCFGSPTVYNGKVYLQTAKKLYCFGKAGKNPGLKPVVAEPWPKAGKPAQLQAVPSEVLMRPGQEIDFKVKVLDENGLLVKELNAAETKKVQWETFIPPTARVKSTMKGSFKDGKLTAATDSLPSAGAFEATYEGLKGYIRGRVLPYLPIKQDFESFQLSETTTNEVEAATAFAYPPLPWIGARFKFEVRDKDGTKALTKTIDNRFFQRATVFLGEANSKNYTIQADVMSEGNRRKMSEVGLINQRYLIVMKGNDQKLEISSNLERLRVPAAEEPSNLKWLANTWYRLKARVDVLPDGSGMIRAKAWKRDETEPEKWTIEVKHKHAHQNGAPGLYGFSPQDMRVFIDNVEVTPNE
jgi:hypothetical protein